MRRENAKLYPPSLRAKRSNPSRRIKEEWIASSQELLAMTINRKTPHRLDHLLNRYPQSRRLHDAEIRRRLPGQRRQHQRHHMRQAFVPRLLLQEVAAEDHAERCAVGE